MNNYIDSYSRYHNKPVTNSDPVPSNNSWIYTAYALKAGLPIDYEEVGRCSILCEQISPRFHYTRSPGKSSPPISRDEILGLSSLELLAEEDLPKWNFSPYLLPKFSLIKLIKQLWELRPNYIRVEPFNVRRLSQYRYRAVPKHRNYFWQNNLDQLYRFAFSVPFSDRHFILKKWSKFQIYNPIHLFYAAFGKLQSKIKPNGLDWLKYDEKKGLAVLLQEFPEDHPIRKQLGL